MAWQFETGDRVRTAPAVVDGGLFVGSDDGFVYGLDAISGAEQWSFETGGAVVSSPAVVDGTVFVGSNDGNVYALTADSGTEQWRFETGGPVRSSPAVGEGHVYVGSDDGFVYGLDAATGESKGEQDIGGEVTAGPCVEIYNAHNDPNVFIGNTRGELYVLWIEPHRFMEKRAKLPLGGAIHSSMASGQSPVGDGENVMFGTDDGTVFSIKVPRSGEFKTGGRVRGSPAVDLGNGQFYIGSGDGSIYALTIADGDLVWKTETGGEVQSSPALAGDTVYVGSDDGAVYGLASKNGQERWRYVTDDKVRSSPAVVDGAVFIGSDDGTVYALTERH